MSILKSCSIILIVLGSCLAQDNSDERKECQSSADCGTDEFCMEASPSDVERIHPQAPYWMRGPPKRECVEKYKDKTRCHMDEMCSSEKCVYRRCVACTVDAECGANEYCTIEIFVGRGRTQPPPQVIDNFLAPPSFMHRHPPSFMPHSHDPRSGEAVWRNNQYTRDDAQQQQQQPSRHQNIPRKFHNDGFGYHRRGNSRGFRFKRGGVMGGSSDSRPTGFSGGRISLVPYYSDIHECMAAKEDREPCLRDEECKTKVCDGGICVRTRDCTENTDCGSEQYCRGAGLGLEINTCMNKRNDSANCFSNFECISDICDGGECTGNLTCKEDTDCEDGEYCFGEDSNLVKNRCEKKRPKGFFCDSDNVCTTAICVAKRCVECKQQSNCLDAEYCAIGQCFPKKCRGRCTSDEQCISSKCEDTGICMECERNNSASDSMDSDSN